MLDNFCNACNYEHDLSLKFDLNSYCIERGSRLVHFAAPCWMRIVTLPVYKSLYRKLYRFTYYKRRLNVARTRVAITVTDDTVLNFVL